MGAWIETCLSPWHSPWLAVAPYVGDIIEFKLNGTAKAALKQIEDKGYAKPYAADSRKLIAIGINFSSEKGTIDGFLPKELFEGHKDRS